MKKIISLILAMLMLLTFAGCGGNGDDTSSPKEAGYTFTANGVKIAMSDEASAIISALGDPISYTEETSCAFEGLDKTYYYGGFYLTTYPENDKDYVFSVWFQDDSVETEEGLYIGSSKADVERIYGAEGVSGDNSYVYTKGSSKLTVILTNDVVSSIQYEAVVE